MLQSLIDFSLNNRVLVLAAATLLAVVGVRSALELPLDAFPDTTPIQVQVNTSAPELSPEEVERLITFPVEYAMGGLKGLDEVRSVSKFGLSQVVLLFDDETDIYFARQQVNERLAEVDLPEGVRPPTMGPVATGLGEIYHYLLNSDRPRDRPDRAADAAGLGDPPPAAPGPRRGRGQRLGRPGQAVRGLGRPATHCRSIT